MSNIAMTGIVNFDSDDKIYNDHFKGNSVVPGSVIIKSFYSVLEKNGYYLKNFDIKNFKFITFLKPGSYSYSIEVKEECFLCKLYLNNKIIVSGDIIKCN